MAEPAVEPNLPADFNPVQALKHLLSQLGYEPGTEMRALVDAARLVVADMELEGERAPRLIENPPDLEIDRRLGTGRDSMSVLSRVSRRVVWNLLKHPERHGIRITHVDDGDNKTRVSSHLEIMELVFNLDDCHLCSGTSRIYIVLGNDGDDVVSDHTVAREPSPWNDALESFHGWKYA